MEMQRINKGFTLIEMVVSLLTVTIVTGLFLVLVNLTSKTYVSLETNSEGQILSSTLTNVIQDELRYATKVKGANGGRFTYKSKTTGLAGSYLTNGRADNGPERIYIAYTEPDTNDLQTYPLVSNSSYIYDVGAHVDAKLSDNGSKFEVKLTIYRLTNGVENTIIETEFEVEPLNPNFKKSS